MTSLHDERLSAKGHEFLEKGNLTAAEACAAQIVAVAVANPLYRLVRAARALSAATVKLTCITTTSDRFGQDSFTAEFSNGHTLAVQLSEEDQREIFCTGPRSNEVQAWYQVGTNRDQLAQECLNARDKGMPQAHAPHVLVWPL